MNGRPKKWTREELEKEDVYGGSCCDAISSYNNEYIGYLEARIARLKQRLSDAETVIDFYGDRQEWIDYKEFNYPNGCNCEKWRVDSVFDKDEGKRARQYREKYLKNDVDTNDKK